MSSSPISSATRPSSPHRQEEQDTPKSEMRIARGRSKSVTNAPLSPKVKAVVSRLYRPSTPSARSHSVRASASQATKPQGQEKSPARRRKKKKPPPIAAARERTEEKKTTTPRTPRSPWDRLSQGLPARKRPPPIVIQNSVQTKDRGSATESKTTTPQPQNPNSPWARLSRGLSAKESEPITTPQDSVQTKDQGSATDSKTTTPRNSSSRWDRLSQGLPARGRTRERVKAKQIKSRSLPAGGNKFSRDQRPIGRRAARGRNKLSSPRTATTEPNNEEPVSATSAKVRSVLRRRVERHGEIPRETRKVSFQMFYDEGTPQKLEEKDSSQQKPESSSEPSAQAQPVELSPAALPVASEELISRQEPGAEPAAEEQPAALPITSEELISRQESAAEPAAEEQPAALPVTSEELISQQEPGTEPAAEEQPAALPVASEELISRQEPEVKPSVEEQSPEKMKSPREEAIEKSSEKFSAAMENITGGLAALKSKKRTQSSASDENSPASQETTKSLSKEERTEKFSASIDGIIGGLAKLKSQSKGAQSSEPQEPRIISAAQLKTMLRQYTHVDTPTLDDEDELSSGEEEPLPATPFPKEEEKEPSSKGPSLIDRLNFSAFNHLLRTISSPLKGELTPSKLNELIKSDREGLPNDSTEDFDEELEIPSTKIIGEFKDLDQLDPEKLKEYTAFTFPCFEIESPELHSIASKCPSLKEVSLFRCHKLTGYGLQAFHDKKLSCFRLFDCRDIDEASLVALIESQVSSLEEIAIVGRSISPSLLEALSKCKKLRELDLSYCFFPEEVNWPALRGRKKFRALQTLNVTRAKNVKRGSKNWRGLDALRLGSKNLIVKGMGTLDEVYNQSFSATTHAISLIAPIPELSEEKAKEKYLNEIREEARWIQKKLSREERGYVFCEARRVHQEIEWIHQLRARKMGQQYVMREFKDSSDLTQLLKDLLRTCNVEPEKTGLFNLDHPAKREEIEAWVQAATDLFKLILRLHGQYSFSDRPVPNFLAMNKNTKTQQRVDTVQQRVGHLHLAGLNLLEAPRMLRTNPFSGLTEVDLRSNQLHFFPGEMIENLCQASREDLLVIDLRENPFSEIPDLTDLGVHSVSNERELASMRKKLKSQPSRRSPRWWGKDDEICKVAVMI